MRHFGFLLPLFILAGFFISVSPGRGQQFNSTSYKVESPVIAPGGYSSVSGSYRLNSVFYQMSIGTSTSAAYGGAGGFLYFPLVTTPTVSATSGYDASAPLSWTAATGYVGWTVGGYSYGQATISGGPYSYTSVGNVLSTTATGLTNGTTYYFVIRVKDSLGNFIATSSQTSATPAAPSTSPVSSPSGGGGGGGGYVPSGGTVNFLGRAYPRSTITILKDAQIATTAIAGVDGKFETSAANLSSGNYIFSVYSEDKDGRRSSLLSFPTSVTSGATANISGIFIAPTVAVDKSEVRRGDDISIFGQSAPQADIVIAVNSDEEFFSKTISDKDGIYLYNFDTSVLEYGSHSAKSKSSIGNQLVSQFSYLANFKVGTKNVAAGAPAKCPTKGNLNNDCRVNLIDFSIEAYWYKRSGFPVNVDLNGDKKIDLIDFSILAYYWTG